MFYAAILAGDDFPYMRRTISLAFLLTLAAAFRCGGATTHVPAGGNLQQAIDNAQLGDTITLQPGATYKGSFRLRKKTGNTFLTITTAAPNSIPAPGVRITPSAASQLAKLVSPSTAPTVRADPGAHHYRFVGLELCAAPGIYSFGILMLGTGTATDVSEQPSDIELDRVYIHGDPNAGGKSGVVMHGRSLTVKNSWISNFKSKEQDTQAISGHNGPGPFTIVNNYLEATGENIMFGAAPAKINGLVPSDIEIRRNHLTKPLAWKSQKWAIKNLLEFKNARRVLIEGNVFEHNWIDSDQYSFAIQLTVRAQGGKMPWAVVEDITIQKNIIRKTGSGINILGRDNSAGGKGRTRNVLIKDNLFYDLDYTQWDGLGRLFQILAGPENLVIDHNTLIQVPTGQNILMFANDPASGFQFKNNIAEHGKYGVSGSGKGTGTVTLSHYAPGYVFLKNALIGGDAAKYPAGNFFPANRAAVGFIDEPNDDYRLRPDSPYKGAGTDGKDLGADIDAVNEATKGVTDGKPPESQPPAAVSVTPDSGVGSRQVFQFVFSDEKGFANINSAHVLFNTTPNPANGCAVRYDQNGLWLRDNAGAAWSGPLALGSGGGLNNSQCTVTGASSSAGGSGKNLSVDLDITFAPSFTGQKTIYMYATNKDGKSGSWEAKGTWSTFVNLPPAAISVTPSSGAGMKQVFRFVFSDGDGFANLSQVSALLSTSSTAQANACYFLYKPQTNEILLRDNAGTAWLGPGRAGNPGSLKNKSCWMDTGATLASSVGTTVTLDVALTFQSSFLGNKTIFMSATDAAGESTGWQSRGTWAVKNSVPVAVSATPSAGQGTSQTFKLLYSDADGYQHIQTAYVLFNATSSLTTGCYIQYTAATNQLWLRNDAGTGWLGPVTPGSASTLQNSRCNLNAAGTTVSGSGTNLTLNLAVAFKNTFTGKKNIYMKVTDIGSASSALVHKGSYQVLKSPQ
jgi:hypothetical protein